MKQVGHTTYSVPGKMGNHFIGTSLFYSLLGLGGGGAEGGKEGKGEEGGIASS